MQTTDTDVLQNSHRATRFNDNLDGTLTDLGTYTAFAPGDGKHSGGFAKPPLIVSKGPMGLAESPMVEPSLHLKAALASGPTIPRRGGPHRRLVADQPVFSIDSDSSDTDHTSIASATRHASKSHQPSSETDAVRRFTMANPDRPYDMWPGKREPSVLYHGPLALISSGRPGWHPCFFETGLDTGRLQARYDHPGPPLDLSRSELPSFVQVPARLCISLQGKAS